MENIPKRSAQSRHLLSRIKKWNDPILKQVCEPVSDDENIDAIVDLMKRVLDATSNGVGLAAPQIGVAKQIILIKGTILVNPSFIPNEEHGKVTAKEGCLSYPDVWCEIERWKTVKIVSRYANVAAVTDLLARIVQHEIDHLNGICLVGDYWREETARKQEELSDKALAESDSRLTVDPA